MERLFVVLVMFTMCWAAPQDLTGKMFTFTQETNTAHVKLTPTGATLGSLTLCLRYFTDLRRTYSLFSLATPKHHNDLLMFKDSPVGSLALFVRDKQAMFKGVPDELNMWMSVCGTWDSTNGISQLWTNGKPSTRKQGYTAGKVLDGNPIIVLGQEQDSYGGNFDKGQSFVGQMSDVHVWNYVLSPCEIMHFTANVNYTPGNVINWRALTYTVSGQVVLEDKPVSCQE